MILIQRLQAGYSWLTSKANMLEPFCATYRAPGRGPGIFHVRAYKMEWLPVIQP